MADNCISIRSQAHRILWIRRGQWSFDVDVLVVGDLEGAQTISPSIAQSTFLSILAITLLEQGACAQPRAKREAEIGLSASCLIGALKVHNPTMLHLSQLTVAVHSYPWIFWIALHVVSNDMAYRA